MERRTEKTRRFMLPVKEDQIVESIAAYQAATNEPTATTGFCVHGLQYRKRFAPLTRHRHLETF
jgi:hypothetical protein